MKRLLPIMTATLLWSLSATAQTAMPPQDFVHKTAASTMFAVESATLALHKTTSPEIKSFAHRLANDRGTTGSSLRQIIAKRSDIALPERPDGHQLDLLRDLAALQGSDFDRAYVSAQRQAQEESLAVIAAYAENGSDPELKAFAEKTLPTLQKLDAEAKALPKPQ